MLSHALSHGRVAMGQELTIIKIRGGVMADTRPAIELTGEDWQDVNTITGIAVGVAIDIQNQTSTAIKIALSATKPAIDFDGFLIPASLSSVATVESGENRVWLLGDGPVSVQET